jgi:hypothetical protein
VKSGILSNVVRRLKVSNELPVLVLENRILLRKWVWAIEKDGTKKE